VDSPVYTQWLALLRAWTDQGEALERDLKHAQTAVQVRCVSLSPPSLPPSLCFSFQLPVCIFARIIIFLLFDLSLILPPSFPPSPPPSSWKPRQTTWRRR
jgi:hypothetical protein